MIPSADFGDGPRPMLRYNFDDPDWMLHRDVPAADAATWIEQLEAVAADRGWSWSAHQQAQVAGNIASLTVYCGPRREAPTIQIAWRKDRTGELSVRARPGIGPPTLEQSTFDGVFDELASRLSDRTRPRQFFRSPLFYEGPPWKGEYWLSDEIRLGPPQQFSRDEQGPQIVFVDMFAAGVHINARIADLARRRRQTALVLAPLIGRVLTLPEQLRKAWVINNAPGESGGASERSLGYLENDAPPGMPARGSAPPVPEIPVIRPGLEPYAWSALHGEMGVPADLGELWAMYTRLGLEQQRQLLGVCNLFSIAESLWRQQYTARTALLVAACEALKPPSETFEWVRFNDVVLTLLGAEAVANLHQLPLHVAALRNDHLHRASLAPSEITSLLASDPFLDPSLEWTAYQMGRVARLCIIEWLRRGGLTHADRDATAPPRKARRKRAAVDKRKSNRGD